MRPLAQPVVAPERLSPTDDLRVTTQRQLHVEPVLQGRKRSPSSFLASSGRANSSSAYSAKACPCHNPSASSRHANSRTLGLCARITKKMAKGMDQDLLAEILERLDADSSPSDDAALLALAACEGEAELTTVLRGEAVPRSEPAEACARVEPAGAFLRAVCVEGFRGIGPEQRLELTPGPGLTLVVGRNGSGKSSFAEALELLLTGDSLRWRNRSVAWREGWRNLHHAAQTAITAELSMEASPGVTTVRRAWPPGANLTAGATEVQRFGKAKAPLAALGWDDALTTYRPFLTYNELGSLLDEGPSKLYDALQGLLGLEDLTLAEKRLVEARRAREQSLNTVKTDLEGLLEELAGLDDERAAACRGALSGKSWDMGAAEAVLLEPAEGDAPALQQVQTLRALSILQPPHSASTAGVVADLRESEDQVAALAGTDADRARQVAELLERALEFHRDHGHSDCPVCGRQGALDDSWQAHARVQATELRGQAAAVEAAHAGWTSPASAPTGWSHRRQPFLASRCRSALMPRAPSRPGKTGQPSTTSQTAIGWPTTSNSRCPRWKPPSTPSAKTPQPSWRAVRRRGGPWPAGWPAG